MAVIKAYVKTSHGDRRHVHVHLDEKGTEALSSEAGYRAVD